MADIVTNSKARHDYHITETYEAGLALRGTEVKALRAGRGQIREAFARIDRNGEAWLLNAHIEAYSHGNLHNHDPIAQRKLLLHRRELAHLQALTQAKGHTLVPLKLYWKNGKVKVLLGVGKGKEDPDKRHDLRTRETQRQMRDATMRRIKDR